jgi:FAD/FMN-containing dehydrogenase
MIDLRFIITFGIALLPIIIFPKTIINDVTNINPIEINQVIVPTTTEEIKNAVKKNSGPISIGGGRFSMGGQTATEQAVQIDMRNFNKILKLDTDKKQITVQAGIRWRDIQDEIDKKNLSIKIMQTYSNFTVGGSLSVNVHGRYVGEGPIIRSVESIKIILADGKEITASRKENQDIFFAAIGGYGGIGVITEATLNLTQNGKIVREIKQLSANKYKNYFQSQIRDNKEAVFHNADIYPPDYQDVSLETWYKTEKPLTIETKLIPRDQKYWLEPNAISSISTLPFGSEIRRKILDPLINKKDLVVWRNYEASYDVAQLEPTTPRLLFTYVLQEYFVPVSKFDEFIPKMRKVFKKNNVNIINVSIRHALPDSGSYLAWAPEEVFSFVIYYKQKTTKSAKLSVKKWTQELIDAALSVNGRYYLPYQIHATQDQFKRSYPNFQKFFDVKKKYDPTNKFRNKLWDEYYK